MLLLLLKYLICYNATIVTAKKQMAPPKLKIGWNLIGFSEDHLSVDQVLALYPEHSITSIWGYGAGGYAVALDQDALKSFPKLRTLRSHKGYWLKVE